MIKTSLLSMLAVAAFAADTTDYPFAPIEMGLSATAGNAHQSAEMFGVYRLGMVNQDAPIQVLASVGSGFCRDDDKHALYLLGGLHGRWHGLIDFGSTVRVGSTDDRDVYTGLSGDATLWLLGSRSWSLGATGSVHVTSETSDPTYVAGLVFTISPFTSR